MSLETRAWVNSKLTTDDEIFQKYYNNYRASSVDEGWNEKSRKLHTCYSSTVSAYDYFDCIGDLKYCKSLVKFNSFHFFAKLMSLWTMLSQFWRMICRENGTQMTIEIPILILNLYN